MDASRRVLRVERELREVLSAVIVQGLKIPLPAFASVVHVDASPDLRSAKVFIKMVGSPEQRKQAEESLLEQRGAIQKHVARSLKTRFCPVLRFAVGGDGQSEPTEIDRLLASLHPSQGR